MADTPAEMSQEERILRMMKKVLTDVAKDTHAKPGFRHSLSEGTVQGIRECLALISARERELAESAGRPMNMRPRFIDEPKKTVVVPLNATGLKKKPPTEEQ
jgi:hypothetical protein